MPEQDHYYPNMRSYRIWTENLGPDELASASVVRLLEKYRLQPLIALSRERESDAMARALTTLNTHKIPIGLWPLLTDDEGYWPSVNNAEAFSDRVWQSLAFAEECGVDVRSVAVDLEPREALKASLSRGSTLSRVAKLWKEKGQTSSEEGGRRFERATRCYSDLAHQLSESGVESLAIVVPPVVMDIISGSLASTLQKQKASTLQKQKASTLQRNSLTQVNLHLL